MHQPSKVTKGFRYLRYLATLARLQVTRRPFVFQDQAGLLFWQQAGDDLRRNFLRRAVSDAGNVIAYARRVVRPGDRCVDIGANIGNVSVALWKLAGPAGRVLSIEADPENVERLKRNLRLNAQPDGDVIGCAISDGGGTATLRRYHGSNGWQTIGRGPSFAAGYAYDLVEVETARLEDVLAARGCSTVDFLKIDVEGAEVMVLNSARSKFETGSVRHIIFEVNSEALSSCGTSVAELLGFWRGLPYVLAQVNQDGVAVPLLDEIVARERVFDCVATLQEQGRMRQ